MMRKMFLRAVTIAVICVVIGVGNAEESPEEKSLVSSAVHTKAQLPHAAKNTFLNDVADNSGDRSAQDSSANENSDDDKTEKADDDLQRLRRQEEDVKHKIIEDGEAQKKARGEAHQLAEEITREQEHLAKARAENAKEQLELVQRNNKQHKKSEEIRYRKAADRARLAAEEWTKKREEEQRQDERREKLQLKEKQLVKKRKVIEKKAEEDRAEIATSEAARQRQFEDSKRLAAQVAAKRKQVEAERKSLIKKRAKLSNTEMSLHQKLQKIEGEVSKDMQKAHASHLQAESSHAEAETLKRERKKVLTAVKELTHRIHLTKQQQDHYTNMEKEIEETETHYKNSIKNVLAALNPLKLQLKKMREKHRKDEEKIRELEHQAVAIRQKKHSTLMREQKLQDHLVEVEGRLANTRRIESEAKHGVFFSKHELRLDDET